MSRTAAVLTTTSILIGVCVLVNTIRRKRKAKDRCFELDDEAARVSELFASSKFLHPWLSCKHFQKNSDNCSQEKNDLFVASFTDLATALASFCGVAPTEESACVNQEAVQKLANEIIGGASAQERRHIIFCLCDGMGNNILDQHLSKDSFLHRHQNKSIQLRAVFPSTTPAALTTLATAAWPGQHGMPGWDLRDFTECDYPGEANGILHQLRVLAPVITNERINEPAASWYQSSDGLERVFVKKPWAKTIRERSDENVKGHTSRRMIYINAYNGDDFQDWHQGESTPSRNTEQQQHNHATDFSSWQMGESSTRTKSKESTLFDAATIGETAYETLGQPEGAEAAIQYFRDGLDAALRAIAVAESKNESTFTYLYTAHPDKHMHTLGTSNAQVKKVVCGINKELERFWDLLGNRGNVLSKCGVSAKGIDDGADRLDAVLIVSADHGHITVQPDDLVVLPQAIVDCLEYANVGVYGPGRHAYLHCRAGLQSRVQELWRSNKELKASFVLLSIEQAVDLGLFGPEPPLDSVRPRLGDFVAISTNNCTLVSPREKAKYKTCRGAHGSLLPEEMSPPFITCVPK